METAKKHFDDASSVHIALSTTSSPSAGNGVLGATGDLTHDPAFEGDVKVRPQRAHREVPVTAVGGKVYAKLPPRPSSARSTPASTAPPTPPTSPTPRTVSPGS